MNKFEENLMLHLFVAVVSLLLGVATRFVALSAGVDNFTATVCFWGSIGLSAVVYLSIRMFIRKPLFMLIHKVLTKQNKVIESAPVPQSTGKTEYVEEKQVEPPTLLDLDKIREERLQKDKKKFDKKRLTAIHYTQKTLAPYISDSDMVLLYSYIDLYAEGKSIPKEKPIKIKGLTTTDIYHFGWNLGNHFHIPRAVTAKFIKDVFAKKLEESTLSTIERKLSNTDSPSTIQLIKKL